MTRGSTQGSNRGRDLVQIRTSVHADCVVVSVDGEIDIHSSPRFGHILGAVAPASLYLVVDLTHLAYIDSSGLGVLIATRNQAQARGTLMVLVHPPPLVRRLLAGTSLQQTFDVCESVDEALAHVHGSNGSLSSRRGHESETDVAG